MKIEFIPFQPSKDNALLQPIPAVQKLPDWYKSKKPFIGDDKKHKIFPNSTKNVTIKWCNPFGDALSSGYFLLLENDIQVSIADGQQFITWHRGGDDFISQHSKQQISEDAIPEGYSDQPWKFSNSWGIKTPLGYSVIFTQPLNRSDLPFLTLSGVVDTDTYNIPVNFPFLLRANFEGIIEAGTPIAQAMPFKREPWKATYKDFDLEKTQSEKSIFYRKIFRPYKLGHWKRKEYK